MENNISIVAFNVEDDNYVYDRYSNEFLKLDNDKFDELNAIIKKNIALPDWLQTAQNELNVLREYPIPQLSISNTQKTKQKVLSKLSGKTNQLIFITTENCNLRCKYCIYSDSYNAIRKHNDSHNLTWEVAQKAIDIFLESSAESSYRYISFYGGEALMNYEIIKKIVSYVNEKTSNMHFAISTNLTLMTNDIADFFIKHRFRITVSLDGPDYIHDTYRLSINAKPTHDIVIKNLNKIREKDETYFIDFISFNILIVPHDYGFDILDEYFNSPLFNGIPMEAFKPLSLNVEENTFSTRYNYETFYKAYYQYTLKKFIEGHINGITDFSTMKISYQLHIGIYKQLYFREMNRLNEYDFYWPNGICILGSRSLFVSPDGAFYPCENLYDYDSLKIGDVDSTIDSDTISGIINEYCDQTIKYCKNCWAYRFCADCFVSAREDSKYSHKKKQMFCNSFKNNLLPAFQNYLWVLKKNPDAFKYLDKEGRDHIINDMRIDEVPNIKSMI